MGVWFIACRVLAGKELYDGWRGNNIYIKRRHTITTAPQEHRAKGNIKHFMFSEVRESGGQEACIL